MSSKNTLTPARTFSGTGLSVAIAPCQAHLPSPRYALFGLELAQGLCMLSWPLSVCVQRTLWSFTTSDAHTVHSCPSSTLIPVPWEARYSPDVLFRAEHSVVSASDQLWVSVLITTPIVLWWVLWYELICGDNAKPPGVPLVLSLTEAIHPWMHEQHKLDLMV